MSQKLAAWSEAMFFWFLVAVGVVVALTLLGAFVSRGDGGWRDDGPMGPWSDH